MVCQNFDQTHKATLLSTNYRITDNSINVVKQETVLRLKKMVHFRRLTYRFDAKKKKKLLIPLSWELCSAREYTRVNTRACVRMNKPGKDKRWVTAADSSIINTIQRSRAKV